MAPSNTISKDKLYTRLFVTCNRFKSDDVDPEDLSFDYDKMRKIVVEKKIGMYDLKSFIFYYPTTAFSSNKKASKAEPQNSDWSKFAKVPRDKYMYRSWLNTDRYVTCQVSYKTGRYLLEPGWVHETFFDIPPSNFDRGANFSRGVLKDKYKPLAIPQKVNAPVPDVPKTDTPKTDTPKTDTPKVNKNNTIPQKEEVEEVEEDYEVKEGEVNTYSFSNVPKILKLKEGEVFNLDGKDYEIETRGKRHYDFIYFKTSDVGKCLGINRIYDTLHGEDSSFKEGEHYIKFNCGRKNMSNNEFFTYSGLLDIISKSRSKVAHNFREWVKRLTYTHHLGTDTQKLDAAAELVKNVPEAFKVLSGFVPGIYLICLGFVKDHKKYILGKETLDSNSCLYKYGRTNNYIKRLKEHQATYGAGITTTTVSIVTSSQLISCEGYTKNFLKSTGIHVPYQCKPGGTIHQEIFCLSSAQLKTTIKYYEDMQEMYLGKESSRVENLAGLIIDKEREAKQEAVQAEHTRLQLEEAIEKNKEMSMLLKNKEIAQTLKDVKDEAAQVLRNMEAEQAQKDAEQTIKDTKRESEQAIKDIQDLMDRKLAEKTHEVELLAKDFALQKSLLEVEMLRAQLKAK